jgi:flagellar protein FlgJ
MSTLSKMIATAPPPAASTAGSNTYTDMNALAALKKNPNSPQAIHAVAQQIDALFLQMMLKSMRDASAEGNDQASNEMGMYQDMFDKQVALTLAQHQDLGLGAQLTRQLAAAAAAQTGGAQAPSPAPVASPAPGTVDADASPAGAGAAGAAMDPGEFVAQVYPAIQRAAEALGVSPLAMLAQAALETGWGKRMARTADGAPSLNLFGIKADENWTGARAAAETLEFTGGVATQRRVAFRAYGSIEESVADFARLLGTSPRYRDAVARGADAEAYVAGIGKSGYATDPEYANKLNDILNSSSFRRALKVKSIAL